MAQRKRTQSTRPPQARRIIDLEGLELLVSPKASSVAKWISELPDVVPVETRAVLKVDLGYAAIDYTSFDATNRVADRELSHMYKIVETLEQLAPRSELTSAASKYLRELFDFATPYPAIAARHSKQESHPATWRIEIADDAYLTTWRELTEVPLSPKDVQRLALSAVGLIGHNVAYRPPTEGSGSIYRAHQGRRKAEPKPDPTFGYLVAVRAVWRKVLDVRAGRSPGNAAVIASQIRTAFPQIPEREILKRIHHDGVTQRSFARFLKTRSKALPALPKTSNGNIAQK